MGESTPKGYKLDQTGQQTQDLLNLISSKQDQLVSGVNIKTIGGVSILGPGDLTLPEEVFHVTGSTTLGELRAAYTAGKVCLLRLTQSIVGESVVVCRCVTSYTKNAFDYFVFSGVTFIDGDQYACTFPVCAARFNGPQADTDLLTVSDGRLVKVPTALSDLSNDAGFITSTVDNLTNYYLKTNVYTKGETEALIAAIQQFHYEVYPTLASVVDPAGNVMYLIGPTGSGADKYEEYVYANDTFVKIGDTSVDLSGVQKFFTEPVNNMLAKEGDILYLAPIAYAENLQNSGDLSTIPIVQESVLKITNKNILFSTTLGKITITGSSPGWPSEILGTIEMVDDNGFRRMAVIDQNNVRHIINYNESFSLATIIHPYGWETPSSYISISETHDSGQTSMLTVVQIDNYRELSIKESRNGNWVDRLPAVVDTTPTSGSDNLVKSGGVADAIASRAQGFFSNTPDTPPVTPKEGDIWDRPAFSMECAGTFIGGVNYLYLPRADMPVTIPLAEGATSISLTIVKTDSTQETLTDISEFPKTYPAGEVASFQAVAGLGTPTQELPAAILEYHNGAWVDRLGVDNAPTQNSQNLVKSGGVYDAIAAKYTKPQTGIPAADLAEGVIPAAQIQTDWNQGTITAKDYLKNKPVLPTTVVMSLNSPADFTGYSAAQAITALGVTNETELQNLINGKYFTFLNTTYGIGIPIMGNSIAYIYQGTITLKRLTYDSLNETYSLTSYTVGSQIQSDWNQADNTAKDFIKNKPSIPAAIDTVNVTVGNNTGTPTGSGSVSGSTLNLAFDNIKGPQGPAGADGTSSVLEVVTYAASETAPSALAWDAIHKFPEMTGLTFTLASVPSDGNEHTVVIVLDTPADASNYNLNYDSSILWANGDNPASSIEDNTRYEIRISSASMIAVYTKVSLPTS